MSYALADRAAAMLDLTAIDGEVVTVAGRSVSAHFQPVSDSSEADQFGADERTETATITFLWDSGALFFGDNVRARGKDWSIAEIDSSGGNLLTLTIEHDR